MSPSLVTKTPSSLIALGLDLIPLSRLSRVLERSPRLFNSLCHQNEHPERCSSHHDGLLWAAMLWTCKEAAVKCVGTGFWRRGVEWNEIQVSPSSRPTLHQVLTATSQWQIHISLSGRASAIVGDAIIEGRFEVLLSEREDCSREIDPLSLIALSHMRLYR